MKKLNINKELEFINGIDYLKKKYGEKYIMNWYWKPQFYKNGLPIINKMGGEILFLKILKKSTNYWKILENIVKKKKMNTIKK